MFVVMCLQKHLNRSPLLLLALLDYLRYVTEAGVLLVDVEVLARGQFFGNGQHA